MPRLIMIMGPQASGKTTLIENMPETTDYVIISSDLYWPRDESGKRYWEDIDETRRDWGNEPMPEYAIPSGLF